MNDIMSAYLKRLGLEAELPSFEALRRLHRAHVERVPYETFWIHLKQGWGIDPLECAERLANTRRGGYCFQLNSAFYSLITSLGYRSSLANAGVHIESGPSVSDLYNHVALVVEGLPSDDNPNGSWWVDVGLGDGLYDPVALMKNRVQQGPMHFEMEVAGQNGVGDWHLVLDPTCWVRGVSLSRQPVTMNAFDERHLFNTTSPESGYVKLMTALLRHASGRSVLRGCVLKKTIGTEVETRIFDTLPEWLEMLESVFGINFDDVPALLIAELWASVQRTHEEWLRTQTQAPC